MSRKLPKLVLFRNLPDNLQNNKADMKGTPLPTYYHGRVSDLSVCRTLGFPLKKLGHFEYQTRHDGSNVLRTCKSRNLHTALKKLDPSLGSRLVSITASNGKTWNV